MSNLCEMCGFIDHMIGCPANPENSGEKEALTMSDSEGRKFDKDKPRWELLPLGPIEAIVKVLTYGAAKPGYSDFNWQKLDNLKDRYYSAMMRHMKKTRDGELIDSESGFSHLAHALCCGIFLLWKEQQGK